MSIGSAIGIGIWTAWMFAAVAPAPPPWSTPGRVLAVIAAIPAEAPALVLLGLAASAVPVLGDGDATATGVVGAAVALGAGAAATVLLTARSLRAGPAMRRALGEGFSGGPTPGGRSGGPWRWIGVLATPLPLLHRGVRREAGIRYGPAARRNLLDTYRPRRGVTDAPVLIHLHGGHFRTGRRSLEGRPLLHRLARRGWVTVSADYRLHPEAVFPDFLVDAKRVVTWVRRHAEELGADPARIVIAGSSAGAHLALMTALTGRDPRFQPGFEDADATVCAAIGLYGYYGPVDRDRQPLPSSPADHAHPGAPPVMIVHGERDTYVPASHAREAARQLGDAGCHPVVFAELPGAQHSFDLLRSIRAELVADGVEAFAARVLRPSPGAPATPAQPGTPSRRVAS
ncbi:MAG: alpha/beta hydrolase [Thermoleophilia bacterium]|nr:alpha/beta hydrolase [Thermoleophilia bacterium]